MKLVDLIGPLRGARTLITAIIISPHQVSGTHTVISLKFDKSAADLGSQATSLK